MKHLWIFPLALIVCASPLLRAQDAAVEERFNKLSGQIEDLLASQKAQQKHIEALAREVENLREQINKPAGNYAAQEDVKQLYQVVKELDRKRVEDYEKIRTEIKSELTNLRKGLLSTPPPGKRPAPISEPEAEKAAKPEKGYEYVVQQGDSLSLIVKAYAEKNIKVTVEQIKKANPGLVPEKIRAGQKIWIPAPQS